MSDFYCEQVIPGKVKVDIIFETNEVMAFHHTDPFWEKHVVIIPKTHIDSLASYPTPRDVIMTTPFIVMDEGLTIEFDIGTNVMTSPIFPFALSPSTPFDLLFPPSRLIGGAFVLLVSPVYMMTELSYDDQRGSRVCHDGLRVGYRVTCALRGFFVWLPSCLLALRLFHGCCVCVCV